MNVEVPQAPHSRQDVALQFTVECLESALTTTCDKDGGRKSTDSSVMLFGPTKVMLARVSVEEGPRQRDWFIPGKLYAVAIMLTPFEPQEPPKEEPSDERYLNPKQDGM